jgi:prevent-host-death family protein
METNQQTILVTAMQIDIQEAGTNLTRLISAAQNGEDVIITEGGKPVARLISYVEPIAKRQIGLFRGKVTLHGNLLEPLPEEIIADI